jgi:HEAT repeat protein
MPRETIRLLAVDAERFLVAGAHLAQGDSALARDRAALDKLVVQLGAKAPPVLAKLSQLTESALTAKPKEQAPALLTLATTVAQVRAAQTQLAQVNEDLLPLEPTAEVGTPCNAKDLYALHDALVVTGPGRMEKIKEALERGDIADLRLVHAVIQALGDPYGELAEVVGDSVVSAFGRAIVEPVRAKLKFPGGVVDGRRLKALVAVEKTAALPLIQQALSEGSPEMREAALDAVATHLPGVPTLEATVLSVLEKERASGVRRAALRALKGYGSDASLSAMLSGLDNERTLDAAAEALGNSKHPNIVERLLERLGVAVQGSKARVKKGDKEAEKRREVDRRIVNALLGALSEIRDPRIVAAARDLIDDFSESAARAVLHSGDEEDLRALADRLAGSDEDIYEIAVRAAIKLGPEEAFARLSPLFTNETPGAWATAKDRTGKLEAERRFALMRAELEPKGDRWVSVLIAAVQSKKRPHHAIRLLGKTQDTRAIAPLRALLQTEKKDSEAVGEIAYALAETGDKTCLDDLITLVESKGSYRWWWAVSSAIERLADAGTVDQVRTAFAKQKDASYSYLRYLLQRLERKFPGA